jgi:hypothetical protein
MKKPVFFLIALGLTLAFNSGLLAQQVVSSAGGQSENSNGSLSWTVGEVAVETLRNNDLILTQGFHQTRLEATGLDIIDGIQPDILAYPNPVDDIINVNIKGLSEIKGWSYILYDTHGRVLENSVIDSDNTGISFSNLPKSTYLLRVYSEKEGAKVFRIIKN